MDEELKRTIEAILFAAARKLELAEIAKLCKKSEAEILAVLKEWKEQLDTSNSPTMLIEDGTAWKLTVREKYVSIIKKVVTKTELPKGIMETLAVVAYKVPVLQSKVIKIRTNKAYDHLSQLENSGYITREKSGRTKLIKLTTKFFEYFDIDPSKLKQKFSSSGDVEKAIEAKEKEIEDLEKQQRVQTKENLEKAEIVLEDGKTPLETYPAVQPTDMLPTGVELFMEKFGDLEVFDVPREEIPPEERLPEHPHKRHHKKPTKKHPHAVHHEHKEKPAVEQVPEEAKIEEPKPEAPKEEAPKVEEAPKEEKPAEIQLTPEQKISHEAAEKTKKMKGKSFEEGKGLYPKGVPPEMEAKIEEKIKKMLSGEPESRESDDSLELEKEKLSSSEKKEE